MTHRWSVDSARRTQLTWRTQVVDRVPGARGELGRVPQLGACGLDRRQGLRMNLSIVLVLRVPRPTVRDDTEGMHESTSRLNFSFATFPSPFSWLAPASWRV